MACPDENTLVAFASGSLSMADASLVDEHLDICPTCFALVAELARTAPEESEPTRLVPIKSELDTNVPTTPAKPPPSVSVKLPPPLGADGRAARSTAAPGTQDAGHGDGRRAHRAAAARSTAAEPDRSTHAVASHRCRRGRGHLRRA